MKGMKHFSKIGYTRGVKKDIPRWACEKERIEEVYLYQMEKLNSDEIFGRNCPKDMLVNIRTLFDGMPEPKLGSRKQRRYDNRGSSAIWNDESEF